MAKAGGTEDLLLLGGGDVVIVMVGVPLMVDFVVVEDAMATGTYWDLMTPNRLVSGNPSGESPWTSTWRTRQLIPGFWTVAGYSTDPFDTCVKLLVPPDIPADAALSSGGDGSSLPPRCGAVRREAAPF